MERYYAFYRGNLVKFKTLDENVSPCITHHSPGDWFSKLWQRWWRSEHLLADLALILPCPLATGLPLGGSDSKESACNAGDLSSIPGLGRSQEKEMATYSSIRAWRIPWTEEPGGLQSTGSQRVRHDLAIKQQLPWTSARRKTSDMYHFKTEGVQFWQNAVLFETNFR